MRLLPSTLVVAVLLAAGPASAVQFVVTDVKDAVDATIDGACVSTLGTCTLRAAVQEANATAAPDEIVLPAGKYVLKLKGAGEDAAATGDLDVLNDLTIAGAGAKTTQVIGKNDRVLEIGAGVEATVSGVTIAKGKLGAKGDLGDAFNGGGIRSDGSLTLTDAVVTGNKASDDGGGIANLGGQLTLTRVVVSKNKAGDDSGGIDNDGGTFVVVDSTVEANQAADEAGGFESDGGTVTATNVTIAKNKAKSLGGGVNVEQGGAFDATNVTLSKNGAKDAGGGLYVEDGTATIRHATFKDNKGKLGGAIFVESGTVALTSTLLDKNGKAACTGAVVSNGGNVESTNTCGFGAGDLPGAGKLKVKGLKANGGPTKTHALDPESPAVDAGLDAGCPPTDQRGLARQDVPGVGTAVCDSGAYELQPVP
jgi:hypothetical protein